MRFRFSLRSLCLLSFITCCVTAWYASSLRYAQTCHAFFAEIEQRGGNVNGLQPGAVSIKFENLTVTDADLKKLTAIRSDLVGVDFSKSNIKHEHVSAISKLTHLRDLGLGSTNISTMGLCRLQAALAECAIHIDRSRLTAIFK